MADDAHDRTEDPTPRRREEARRQGQIAYSADLTGSAVLLAGVVGLRVLGPGIANGFRELLLERFHRPAPPELSVAEAAELAGGLMTFLFRQVGPLLLLLVAAGVAACVVQVGLNFSTERLDFNVQRLDPSAGFSRLFSTAGLVKGLLALLRVAVLAAVVVVVMRSRAGVFAGVSQADLGAAADAAWQLVMRISAYLAGVFCVIGVVDYAWQRYRLEQSLRMSKQELKEEMKREEGDPMLKARMRRMGREMAGRRMLAEVSMATAVVTNPTHYAVAVRYDRATMKAPRLVAKGRGVLARRIAQDARRYGIPVLERPALAQALFRGVEVGREVPPALFVAVAEVIAFVYRLRNPQHPGA
jgi:flagellar biosynthetic protein FlhB